MTSQGTDNISLSWNKVARVNGYQVYISNGSGGYTESEEFLNFLD